MDISHLAKESKSTFSDNVVCVRHRSGKTDEKKKKFLVKDGILRLLFMDGLGGPKIVADVTVTRSQAYNLMELLSSNLRSLEKEMKEMSPSKKPSKKQDIESTSGSYVG